VASPTGGDITPGMIAVVQTFGDDRLGVAGHEARPALIAPAHAPWRTGDACVARTSQRHA
jgi:hypothetical protein